MPVTKSVTPLYLKLMPSLLLQRFNAVIHLMALLATLITQIAWFLKLTLVFCIIADYLIYRRRFKIEHTELSFTEKDGWQIFNQKGIQNIQIQSSTVISPWCVFLHLQGMPTVLIAKDSLSDEDYRRLIVKLKTTHTKQE